MNIANQIGEIRAARNIIRNKLAGIGVVETTDKLSTIAEKLVEVHEYTAKKDKISGKVAEGSSFVIPAGFHDGSGTVVVDSEAVGANYRLQAKTAKPSKTQQVITADTADDFYGLSSVTIEPIEDKYQDVSDVNVVAKEVLSGKIFVTAKGEELAGEMPNQGKVTHTLDIGSENRSYTIPEGYHNGQGSVSITVEADRTVTPGTSAQTVEPQAGKVLGKVIVAKIPERFADTTHATIEAGDILYGKKGYGVDAEGKAKEVNGTMPNNGAINLSISGLYESTSYVDIPAGYTSGGRVSLTGEIEAELATI